MKSPKNWYILREFKRHLFCYLKCLKKIYGQGRKIKCHFVFSNSKICHFSGLFTWMFSQCLIDSVSHELNWMHNMRCKFRQRCHHAAKIKATATFRSLKQPSVVISVHWVTGFPVSVIYVCAVKTKVHIKCWKKYIFIFLIFLKVCNIHTSFHYHRHSVFLEYII